MCTSSFITHIQANRDRPSQTFHLQITTYSHSALKLVTRFNGMEALFFLATLVKELVFEQMSYDYKVIML